MPDAHKQPKIVFQHRNSVIRVMGSFCIFVWVLEGQDVSLYHLLADHRPESLAHILSDKRNASFFVAVSGKAGPHFKQK